MSATIILIAVCSLGALIISIFSVCYFLYQKELLGYNWRRRNFPYPRRPQYLVGQQGEVGPRGEAGPPGPSVLDNITFVPPTALILASTGGLSDIAAYICGWYNTSVDVGFGELIVYGTYKTTLAPTECYFNSILPVGVYSDNFRIVSTTGIWNGTRAPVPPSTAVFNNTQCLLPLSASYIAFQVFSPVVGAIVGTVQFQVKILIHYQL